MKSKLDKFDENLYRSLLRDCLDNSNMKMSTVSLYLVHILCFELGAAVAMRPSKEGPCLTDDLKYEKVEDAAAVDEKPRDRVNNLYLEELVQSWRKRKCFITTPLEAVNLLQSLFILPNEISLGSMERKARLAAQVDSSEREKERFASEAAKIGRVMEAAAAAAVLQARDDAFDYDPELLSLPLVVEIGQVIKESAADESSLAVVPYVQHLFHLLNAASRYSLVNTQARLIVSGCLPLRFIPL
jgi:hypothetical protein